MIRAVPPLLFWGLASAASSAFGGAAYIKWRSDDTYHAVLAVVIAVLLLFVGRRQRPTWLIALLLAVMVALGIHQGIIGIALIRAAMCDPCLTGA